jgi:hypothetical protein
MVSRVVACPRTDSMISRMILYTIATGLVTGIFSCVALALVRFRDFLSFFGIKIAVLK